MIIALKGKMASGKSTIANKLSSEYGFEVFDCDLEVHKLYETKNEITDLICETFDLTFPIDRQELGSIVFQDNEKRLKLEAIVYPYLTKLIEEKNHDRLVIDGYNVDKVFTQYDYMLLCVCDQKTLIERALERKNKTEDEIVKILNIQSNTMLIKAKTYTLNTNENNDALIEKLIRSFDANSNWKDS